MEMNFFKKTIAATNGNITIGQLIEGMGSSDINEKPICQRNPVGAGYKKSQAIIGALASGLGVGSMAIRDISDESRFSKELSLYNGATKLVLDGGHRCRAIKDFYSNKFPVNGLKYSTLSDKDKETFKQISIPVTYYVCDSESTGLVFDSLNSGTPIKEIEAAMSNEVSDVAKFIRGLTEYYSEYDNEPHELFSVAKVKGNDEPLYFSGGINPSGKWEELVGVAFLKSVAQGHINAGIPDIKKSIDEDVITSAAKKRVIRFLDVAVEAIKARRNAEKKFNTDTFGAFMTVYFDLYERSKNFKIPNVQEFSREFFSAHQELTGRDSSDELIKYGPNPDDIDMRNKFIRSGVKKYANSEIQKMSAEFYFEISELENMVEFLSEKRTENKAERASLLSKQGMVCAIDGRQLALFDAEFGHIKAHSEGGDEGVMIRKYHNRKMGQMNLNDYKEIWDSMSSADQIQALLDNTKVFAPDYKATL